ncbi:helix-turn-helix domain-containing protein [Halomonas elongata]|uniref:helix-turn-helix domain-containing protein n=1 Tax=Halomonas elongata TaxID=2746 RepID=UPI00255A9E66|nr:helix-turn-helix domain-containing protein [Halomonas elongata]MDL4861977.1 helix-turn-helix domain-containing protein [Halomonas elongata]
MNWQGGHLSLPKPLMEHPDFREASPSAMKVLMALGNQYNGKNNGNLSATETTMQQWGGMSHTTLAKALKELQERNLIIKTRTNYKGRYGARCALYALTWFRIDPCPGKDLEVKDTDDAPRKLRKAGSR